MGTRTGEGHIGALGGFRLVRASVLVTCVPLVSLRTAVGVPRGGPATSPRAARAGRLSPSSTAPNAGARASSRCSCTAPASDHAIRLYCGLSCTVPVYAKRSGLDRDWQCLLPCFVRLSSVCLSGCTFRSSLTISLGTMPGNIVRPSAASAHKLQCMRSLARQLGRYKRRHNKLENF